MGEWFRNASVTVDQLRAYAADEFAGTEAYDAGLDDQALGRGIDLSFVGLGEKPASEVITMLVVQHCDNLSGELSAVKGVFGLKGLPVLTDAWSGGAAAASTMAQFWGGSSVGRALHSHCRGQGFESPSLHSKTARHGPIVSSSASASVPPGRVQAARFSRRSAISRSLAS